MQNVSESFSHHNGATCGVGVSLMWWPYNTRRYTMKQSELNIFVSEGTTHAHTHFQQSKYVYHRQTGHPNNRDSECLSTGFLQCNKGCSVLYIQSFILNKTMNVDIVLYITQLVYTTIYNINIACLLDGIYIDISRRLQTQPRDAFWFFKTSAQH